jgi:hypothetical protein
MRSNEVHWDLPLYPRSKTQEEQGLLYAEKQGLQIEKEPALKQHPEE